MLEERLKTLERVSDGEAKSIKQLAQEKTAHEAEIDGLTQTVAELVEKLVELEAVLAQKQDVVSEAQKRSSESERALDKALKEVDACVRILLPSLRVVNLTDSK